MASEKSTDAGKDEGGDRRDDKPQPACTVYIQGRCTGTGCACPASGGAR